jgi:hypothetical protein
MTTAAYGMYPHNAALAEIVCALNRAGFSNEDICMVLSPAHPAANAVRDARIAAPERADTASSARTIGWFSEFGAVVIPSVGFFIRSLPFFHALIVDQNSSALCGGRSRTFVNLGFSEEDAKRLDGQMNDEGALVYVTCPERSRAESASALLRRAGARESATP